MIAKLNVIFFILVCLMVGSLLILLPWSNLGGGDWSNNFFIYKLIDLTGFESISTIMMSGWFRGAVTGLGVFNLLMAFWEIANFNQSVSVLETGDSNI